MPIDSFICNKKKDKKKDKKKASLYIFTPVDAFMTKTQFSDVCIQLGGECVFIAKKKQLKGQIFQMLT